MDHLQSCNEALKKFGIQINSVPRPRAPPRLIRPPAPVHLERPQPLVPDVSLILNSASTSIHSNVSESSSESENLRPHFTSAANLRSNPDSEYSRSGRNGSSSDANGIFANYYPTPPHQSLDPTPLGNAPQKSPHVGGDAHRFREDSAISENTEGDGEGKEGSMEISRSSQIECSQSYRESADILMMKSDISSILTLLGQQQNTISKLTSQMQEMILLQQKCASQLLQRSNICKESKAIQTFEDAYSHPLVTSSEKNCRQVPIVNPRLGENYESPVMSQSNNITSASKEKSKSAAETNAVTSVPAGMQPPTPIISNQASEVGHKHTDLSTFLKNFQVQNIEEPTVFSENSFRSVDLNQLNNDNDSCLDVGASVSECGSDDELEPPPENATPPPAIYYTNLLGTVNRMLEGGRDPNDLKTCRDPKEVCSNRNPNNIGRNQPSGSNTDPVVSIPCGTRTSSTASYSSGSSCSTEYNRMGMDFERKDSDLAVPNQNGNNAQPPRGPSENVVDATKRYLQSLGVQFDSPTRPGPHSSVPRPQQLPTPQQKQNYMIQQNVFNSIYIPTVNCVPVVSDSLNSNSGVIDNLAQKYIPNDLRQLEKQIANDNKHGLGGGNETTVYGMSSNNLSFATKQYLQRYGLVNATVPMQATLPEHDAVMPQFTVPPAAVSAPRADRILDITAIRNQPKLL